MFRMCQLINKYLPYQIFLQSISHKHFEIISQTENLGEYKNILEKNLQNIKQFYMLLLTFLSMRVTLLSPQSKKISVH